MISIEAGHPNRQSPRTGTEWATLTVAVAQVCRSSLANKAFLAPRLAAIAVAVALGLPAVASASVSPLPESDYTTRPLCGPPALGEATCLATMLVPVTAAARARNHPLGMASSQTTLRIPRSGAYGLTPNDLRSAYFPGERPEEPVGEPQTIALVDEYDDPEAEFDLRVYSEKFGLPVLPPCKSGAVSDCFEKVNERGETGNLPVAESQREREAASGWAGETSMDIEAAHGVCRNCRILLVEARYDLEAAVRTAEQLGATEISNSWSVAAGGEPSGATGISNSQNVGAGRGPSGAAEISNSSIEGNEEGPFDDPGIVITAAAGDWGYLDWDEGNEAAGGLDYPASSPDVIAVGGTELTLTATGARASETVWNEGAGEEKDVTGGGCSPVFSAPPWQTAVPDWAAVGCGTGAQAKRAVADVAVDGAPYTGAAIYDSVPYEYAPGETVVPGWVTVGGSSLSSPIVAALFALVGGAHGVEHPATTLYSHLGGASLYDVTSGGDGKCDGIYGKGCEGSMSPLSPLDCGERVLICNAGAGYDGPSGVGAPASLAAFEAGPEAEHAKRVAVREAAAKKAEEEQQAVEKKAAEERRAAERKAAEERQKAAEERKIVEERLAAERKPEEERKAAEEQKVAEQKAEEERKAEEAKRAAEAKAKEERIVAEERKAAEQKLEEEQQAKRDEEELRKTFEANGLLGKGKDSSAGGRTVRLSSLALTARASAAIARGLPALSQVTFAFDLSGPTRIQATLSRLLTTHHGHARWVAATGALTIAAEQGRNSAHLRGSTTLTPGSYRLKLAPAHGAARSLEFTLAVATHSRAGG